MSAAARGAASTSSASASDLERRRVQRVDRSFVLRRLLLSDLEVHRMIRTTCPLTVTDSAALLCGRPIAGPSTKPRETETTAPEHRGRDASGARARQG